jgi:putative transposon-encoded protein
MTRILWTLTLVVMVILCAGTRGFGLMAPEHYAARSEQALVKAIATIDRVALLEVGRHFSLKRVFFQREFVVSEKIEAVFNGTCRSIDTPFQKSHGMVGPNVYFSPRAGQRVYVTITDPGGEITSLTPVTPELEKALRTAPETVRYGVSRAFVQK